MTGCINTLAVRWLPAALAFAMAGQALAEGWSWPSFDGGPQTAESLYRSRCGGCHALDHNKYGPAHHALIGRTAGTQPGYRYSEALAKSGIVWTPTTLDLWLTNPRKMVPGTRMAESFGNPDQRRLIIDFLKSRAGVKGLTLLITIEAGTDAVLTIRARRYGGNTTAAKIFSTATDSRA